MSIGHRSLRAAGLLCLAGLLAFPGCVENRSSLTILQMQVPNADCTVDTSEDRFLPMGALDIYNASAVNVQYFMYPLLKNNLLPTASENDLERNYIEVIEARVELDFGALGGALDSDTTRFRYPAFKTFAPGESAPLVVLGIPTATARVIANLLPNPGDSVIVRARVKFLYQHGEYEHETHEVEFPILVGRYILFTPPAEMVNCDSGLLPDNILTGNACNPYQDLAVDCCQSGSLPVCPAVDTSSTL